MKCKILALVVTILALAVGTASAQSAKATAQVDELITIGVTPGPVDLTSGPAVNALNWTTILTQTIKVPSQKDLFIGVSLECGLFTKTKVVTSGGITDTETADAGIRVRVKITDADGNSHFAVPDQGRLLDNSGQFGGATAAGSGVSFCRRFQQLSAKLQGILSCPIGVPIPGGCTVTPEEIELILSTLDANAFNFIDADLPSGNYTIEVQAVGITFASSSDAASAAVAGAGSVTIEVVRMIKGEDFIVP